MTGPLLSDVLTNVQFVEAPSGRRLAVIDADDWDGLIEWLEDLEDRQIVRVNLTCRGPGLKHRAQCRWSQSSMSYTVFDDTRPDGVSCG